MSARAWHGRSLAGNRFTYLVTCACVAMLFAPHTASAQTQSPGCMLPTPLPNAHGVEPGKAYKYRIDYAGVPAGPSDPNAYTWWTANGASREASVEAAFNQWTFNNVANGSNASFQRVPSNQSADIIVRVHMGGGRLPGCNVPAGFDCDAVTSLKINASTHTLGYGSEVWLKPTLDSSGVLSLTLHEGGHLHGLGDMPAAAAPYTTMGSSIPASQRLGQITGCDSAVAGTLVTFVGLGVLPAQAMGCPPGGCQTPGLPCQGSSFDTALGWCYPANPGGFGSVTTDWWWWLIGSTNVPPSLSIVSPPHGAVLNGPFTGSVVVDGIDPDGRVVRVDYYINDQYSFTATQWPYAMPVAGVPAGAYKVQVHAFDNRADSSWSSPIWVTVQGNNGCGGCGGPDTLTPGQRLYAGQFVQSPNLAYGLVYQYDGNLVLYGPSGAQWSIGVGASPGYAEMQADGNLVTYDASGLPYWATMTFAPGSYLKVQNDGNVVIYSATGVVWALW